MLDVHILRMSYTSPEYVAACIAGVEAAAAAAGFPVAVHVVDGLYGHLGASRASGYAHGTHPYVTSVDDDDLVDENAFAVLGALLRSGVAGITTGERNLKPNGTITEMPDAKHHLAVYRRDLLGLSDYADFMFFPDQRLMSQFTLVHIPLCVYTHRQHDSGSKKQRRANKAAADAEYARLKPGYIV